MIYEITLRNKLRGNLTLVTMDEAEYDKLAKLVRENEPQVGIEDVRLRPLFSAQGAIDTALMKERR